SGHQGQTQPGHLPRYLARSEIAASKLCVRAPADSRALCPGLFPAKQGIYFRTASLNAFAGRRRTTVLALILIASPVWGLRPMRALRCAFTTRPIPGMTNLPAPPLASFTASLCSSSKKATTVFLAVPTFSAMCATIFVLLSGLAAIFSAYPPEFSIHPEGIEASRERKTPVYQGKTRAARDYSEGDRGTQGENSKKRGKNAYFFAGMCKSPSFHAVMRSAELCYPCALVSCIKEKR